ncbi:hypothetical protein T492DRAFT_159329 [Pavlovales sp. CCMP2436]|nr:hypothetical protein T492DRAFT_159329 [Pavlovales sp. CCMP2436]
MQRAFELWANEVADRAKAIDTLMRLAAGPLGRALRTWRFVAISARIELRATANAQKAVSSIRGGRAGSAMRAWASNTNEQKMKTRAGQMWQRKASGAALRAMRARAGEEEESRGHLSQSFSVWAGGALFGSWSLWATATTNDMRARRVAAAARADGVAAALFAWRTGARVLGRRARALKRWRGGDLARAYGRWFSNATEEHARAQVTLFK